MPVEEEKAQLRELELELRVSQEAERAKRALHEYREASRPNFGRTSRASEAMKRRVERAVARYIQSLKDLTLLREQTRPLK
ncbi:MAG TPA: hypothetical protein VGV87_15125 [Blastocatellia bacterium]|jgi:hypothetical protein|nr:hypothetical protein [Blastocatellia bacterium]